MRQFPNKLSDIIDESGQKLHTISKNSGISHTYLTKLTKGNINYPGKDKIASILLSLNYSIGEINDVLADYDYRPLNKKDIPEIKHNNRKRKIEGNTMAFYDHIYFELLLAAMERIGGTKLIVKDRPSSVYMPEDLYLKREFPFEKDGAARDFRIDFTLALIKERKELFLENCENGHRFETFICRRCLEDYLDTHLLPADQWEEEDEFYQRMTLQYFANFIGSIVRQPDQHLVWILKRCSYFEFTIQDAEGTSPKICFTGRKPHEYDHKSETMIMEGFTSDAPAVVELYRKEIEYSRSFVDQTIAADYPTGLVNYLVSLFEKKGLGNELTGLYKQSAKKLSFSLF